MRAEKYTIPRRETISSNRSYLRNADVALRAPGARMLADTRISTGKFPPTKRTKCRRALINPPPTLRLLHLSLSPISRRRVAISISPRGGNLGWSHLTAAGRRVESNCLVPGQFGRLRNSGTSQFLTSFSSKLIYLLDDEGRRLNDSRLSRTQCEGVREMRSLNKNDP